MENKNSEIIEKNQVRDHTKYACFDYVSSTNNNDFRLGDVLFKEAELVDGSNPIGVVLQLHDDGDCRTDQYGNTNNLESRYATLEEIKKYRRELLGDLKLYL